MHSHVGLQSGWYGQGMEEGRWDKYFSSLVSTMWEGGLLLAGKVWQHLGRSYGKII